MKPKRILIVDDDRDFAESMAENIELEEHHSFVANSGQSALEIISQNNFDLVFMGIRMPTMNGIDTFKEALKLKPDIRVAMMTGYSDKVFIDAAIEIGAIRVLSKPVNIADLISVIAENDSRKTVLLVDDDVDFSEGLKSSLELNGFNVVNARTVDDALNLALNNKISLLLLDIRLLEASGLEVHRELRLHDQNIPTIIITAYSREEAMQIEQLKLDSITHVFQKPFNQDDLIKAIRELSDDLDSTFDKRA